MLHIMDFMKYKLYLPSCHVEHVTWNTRHFSVKWLYFLTLGSRAMKLGVIIANKFLINYI